MGSFSETYNDQRKPPFLFPVSDRFVFVYTLSQFRGPDYPGAGNKIKMSLLLQIGGEILVLLCSDDSI